MRLQASGVDVVQTQKYAHNHTTSNKLNKMKIKLLTHVTRTFCASQISSCADQTNRNETAASAIYASHTLC